MESVVKCILHIGPSWPFCNRINEGLFLQAFLFLFRIIVRLCTYADLIVILRTYTEF
jgi:hypothetical protein